jgi:creatinine amidohydrolase/Fe(II)-dependent formamide hydrolase-like protein
MVGGAVAHPSLHSGQAPAATPKPDVRLSLIKNEVLISEAGAKEAGIWGRDPRTDASRELGEKIVSRIADNMGKKAQELLAGLRK